MAIEFARRLALIGFIAASIRGLIRAADFQATIQTALAATAIFYVLGLIFGDLARRVVEDQVATEIGRLQYEVRPRAAKESPGAA